MKRRAFIKAGTIAPMAALPIENFNRSGVESPREIDLPPLPFKDIKSNLKITEVRMVTPKRKKPWPEYTPKEGSWSTGGVEVANPMSIYPKYKPRRSLFMAEGLGPTAVQITTGL